MIIIFYSGIPSAREAGEWLHENLRIKKKDNLNDCLEKEVYLF